MDYSILLCIAGRIVVETSLPSQSSYYGAIVSVKPIAVPPSERAEFTITGVNLSRPSTRYAEYLGIVIDVLKAHINHDFHVHNTVLQWFRIV